MAFGQNPYFGSYPQQPAYPPQPPMPDQLAQLRGGYYQQPVQAPAMPPPSSLLWVGSEAEARMYPVAPNNAVQLWNQNAPYVYLKQCDASGKPSFETYRLIKETMQEPAQAAQQPAADYVTREDYNTLFGLYTALSERLDAISGAAKEDA